MKASDVAIAPSGKRTGLRESEWIWSARILLCLVYLATGSMRLTLPPSELARLGDWTLGLLPSAVVGLVQIGAASGLLLPRRGPWIGATLFGAFVLTTLQLGSLLSHLGMPGRGWAIDALRLAGIAFVVRDLWRAVMLGSAQET